MHRSFHFGLKASNLVELKIRALQAILDMEPPLKMVQVGGQLALAGIMTTVGLVDT